MTHTIESLKATMRKAYDEGRLMAQEPGITDDNQYYYQKGRYGCAVGVCLTVEEASKISPTCTLGSHIGETYFSNIFTDRQVFEFARRAQKLHDMWASDVMFRDHNANARKNAFLAFIDHPEAV